MVAWIRAAAQDKWKDKGLEHETKKVLKMVQRKVLRGARDIGR